MGFGVRLWITAVVSLGLPAGFWAVLRAVGTDPAIAAGSAAGLAAVLVTLGGTWVARSPDNSPPSPDLAISTSGPGKSTVKGPTSHFIGRETEVAKVSAAVAAAPALQDLQAVFVIHGMPGVGKSTLAFYLAHRLGRQLSKQIRRAGLEALAYEVDLHGFDDLRETDPADGLRRLLKLEQVPAEQLAQDADGLAEQWRGRVSGKFLILVLDNAADGHQVLPFLPGAPGYIVLVTSRRSLPEVRAGRGATPLPLRVLSRTESVSLIKKIFDDPGGPHDQEALEGIAEFCGDLPLAINMTVVSLAGGSWTSFADMLAQLKAVPNRLLAVDEYASGESGPVARSFEFSYRQLPEDCQLMLRRLGLAPVAVITEEVAAALSGLPRAAAGAALRRLAAEALLEKAPAGYQIHDLIRHYAKSLAEDDDPASNAAVNEVLAYYLDAATYVDATLTRQPPPIAIEPPTPAIRHEFTDRGDAIAWMRAGIENLLACADYVVREADGAGHDQEKAWVVMFAAALAGFLRNDRLWPRSIELQTKAIIAAGHLDNPLAEANARHERAFLHRLSNHLPEAEADLKRALAIYRQIGGHAGEIGETHVLNTYGVVLDQMKQPDEAKERLSSSLAASRRLGYRLGEANTLNDQGMEKYFARQYDQAAVLLGQALARYQAVDQLLGQAHAHSFLARAQRQIGLDRDAAVNLEAAQALYRQLGNQLGEATTATELGAVLRSQGDDQRADAALRHAVDINEQRGNQVGLANAYMQWGAHRGEMGDLAGAKDHLMRSLELFRGVQRDEGKPAEILTSLGLSHEPGPEPRASLLIRGSLIRIRRKLSASARKLRRSGSPSV